MVTHDILCVKYQFAMEIFNNFHKMSHGISTRQDMEFLWVFLRDMAFSPDVTFP